MPLEINHRRPSSVSQSSFSSYSHPVYTPALTQDNYEMGCGPLGLRTLNQPNDAYLEVIFIHGFPGDSSLTWTFDNDRAMFWPEWLSEDIELSGVRLHTYGYHESSVNGRAPVSRMRDIGVGLAAAMDVSILVRGDSHRPIVFVAHSLGGLVVKAAIESAKRNANYADLARRIYGVLFLATPHRDTDDRQMLNGILRSCAVAGSGQYSGEPEPNISVLQEINNSFFACSQNLQIYNFYGTFDQFVDRKRGTLNIGQDREIRVNADHVSVARFQSSSDPTYITIRDVILSLTTDIYEELHSPEKLDSQMRTLANYLHVNDTEDEDLAQKVRVPGSCDWLLEEPTFEAWRDRDGSTDDKQQQVYWLSGDPGCGKSYLAARVIGHLQERGCDSSYFFLKHGDISKQSVGALLKSIAYQMARLSASARRSLLAMESEDTLTAESTDSRALWKQLYVQRIFRAEPERHHYWVIDALDEAKGGHELFYLLQWLPPRYSVFITSRKDRELERELRHVKAFTHEIQKADTLHDIRAYLEHNEEDLHVDETSQMEMLIQKLIEKSNGSFLWTSLIRRELAEQWDEDAIEAVLKNMPNGMQHLYTRILRKIAHSTNSVLAKAILRWVVCSIRPMSVVELRTAIRLETGRTLSKSAQAVESICQPLVRVNKDRVEVVHDTIRDYLFNKDRLSSTETVSDFLFDRGSSHEHIATTCLVFLTQSLRTYTWKEAANTTDDDKFLVYASSNFSEHIVKSASSDESAHTHRLHSVLFDFFQGPILSWIQRQAETRSLSMLTRVGKNLKAYVARRRVVPTHLDGELHDLHGWADDLIHLVTAFGKELYKEPESIHTVIPSLCPSQSKIYSELRNPDVSLQVQGLSTSTWPDHISSSSFGRDYAVALACCEKRYAVSLRSNQIVIYYTTTCQEARRIATREAIRRLEFANIKSWLIASGRKSLTMFNYETGDEIWTTPTPTEILALAMPPDCTCILAVTREKAVLEVNIATGTQVNCRQLELSGNQGRPPMQVYVSYELKTVAVLHRHEPLELYDLDSLQRSKGRISYSATIETIAFNQTMNMLAMAAFHGELCTVELFGMKIVQRVDTDASHLACSVDGNTLIVGTKAGDIQIHDFHTLAVLHNIRYYEEEFMGLCFTSNSLRFLDIRRQVFNVWEPAALVRWNEDDETASSDGRTAFSTAPSELMQSSVGSDTSPITAIVEHHTAEHIFCAKENGSITIYETSHARPKQKVLEYGRTEVICMVWNQARNLLACADTSSTVRVHQVIRVEERRSAGPPKTFWKVSDLLKRPLQQPVRQVLLSPDGEFLLACTTNKEYIFRTSGGAPVLVTDCSGSRSTLEQPQAQKWAVFSRKKQQMFEVNRGVQVIAWDKDGSRLRVEKAQATSTLPGEPTIAPKNAHLVPLGSQLWAASDNNPHTPPILWSQSPAALPDPTMAAKMTAFAIREFEKIAEQIGSLIGLYRNRMVFVSNDHWVCSVRIDKSKFEDPVRTHFPMPHSWRRSNRPLKGLVTSKGDVVFAVEGDLVVVKKSL